jgi:predicted ATPase/DNA-binding winged helix-turn-helix (wHTH) protein
MHAASEARAGIAFGRFLLLPQRRELLADGRAVKLGGRAYDVLMALIEARGAVVGKDALMARVWPDRIVEENNLQWQISALRAAFGADRDLIRTVSGRGYQFTAEVDTVYGGLEADAGTPIGAVPPDAREACFDGEIPGQLPPTNLPELISALIGRDDVLDEILSLASAHRLVTLTGAGGIGKTRLALAAARRVLPQFADGVWLAEFSPIADPGLVPVTVATAIGLDLGGGDVSARRLSQALAGRRLVLVLDTCEHVISAAATLAEAVLRAGGTLRLFATSREPLRVEGEWVYPVPPLAVPAANAEDMDDLLRYGGVRLFVERLRAGEPHFAPDRRSAATIAAICRRLDGIPLAIELAAARAAVLGVEEVATHLDNRFRILTGGRRTALPRHQTLRATFDWSYELLSGPERVILRRLAVFAGVFRLEAARAVVASPEITPTEVMDGIASLVVKSLVVVSPGSTIARCRLLDTMRAYGLEKLAETREREWLARRHGEYYRDFFEQAEAEWGARPTADWLADYAPKIDNLRAALDWASSPDGDAAIGVALTAAAVPLWMQLSLMEECRRRVEHALARLDLAGDRDLRREMRLHAALGTSLNYTTGPISATEAAWAKTLEIAKILDDSEFQLRALRGRWAHHMNAGEYRRALEFAQDFRKLAETSADPADLDFGNRMVALMLHYLGDQGSARSLLEQSLAHPPVSHRRPQTARFLLDQDVTVQALLSRIFWLQGFADQATRTAQIAVDKAAAIGHALSLCHALAQAACPVALYTGDLAAAEGFVETLLDVARDLGLAGWTARSHCFQGVMSIMRDDFAVGLPQLRGALNELREVGAAPGTASFLTVLARGSGRAGRVSEGMAAIEQALMLSERYEERWSLPELLRNKGELILLQRTVAGTETAEDLFRQALDVARRQGSLSWELRAATSLARLMRDQGRSAEAVALLQPVYDRFTEGFETADLEAARNLLNALPMLQEGAAS